MLLRPSRTTLERSRVKILKYKLSQQKSKPCQRVKIPVHAQDSCACIRILCRTVQARCAYTQSVANNVTHTRVSNLARCNIVARKRNTSSHIIQCCNHVNWKCLQNAQIKLMFNVWFFHHEAMRN